MPLMAEIYLTEDNFRKAVPIERADDVTHLEGGVLKVRATNETLLYPKGEWKRVRIFESNNNV